jgi:hypothetical protein
MFLPHKKTQHFCSKECYAESMKGIPAPPTRRPRGRKGDRHHNWKGGGGIVNHYAVNHSPGHPRAHGGTSKVYQHILVAEKALGHALPADACVHHVDEVKTNNTNSNLVICENNAYHRLIHARLKIVKRGGDPNREKVCSKCRRLLDHREFTKNVKSWNGLGQNCRGCAAVVSRQFRAPRSIEK